VLQKGIGIGVALVLAWAGASGAEETPDQSFGRICGACHGEPPVPRAMSRDAMAQLPPEHIYKVISEGRMAIYAISLGAERQRALARHVSSKAWGEQVAAAEEILVRCDKPARLDASVARAPQWSGWSRDLDNTRFQPADQAGLEAKALGELELRW
jgi:polyvinyl alcohol dehydrogenase (cytochrome)